jgi:two-component system NarL family response regulator
MIRIICVEDHAIVSEGIKLILEREPDMEVVGLATDGQQAVDMFRRYRPDVTLMDLQLPLMNGVDAIHAIRREDAAARIVVLTMYEGDDDIYRALEAGATTYLLKNTLSEGLVGAVRDVHAGRQPILPLIREKLSERDRRPVLTMREIEVLELVSIGLRNKEISKSLRISEETVHVHVRNILEKLDARDRTAAVHIALRRGIIHIS